MAQERDRAVVLGGAHADRPRSYDAREAADGGDGIAGGVPSGAEDPRPAPKQAGPGRAEAGSLVAGHRMPADEGKSSPVGLAADGALDAADVGDDEPRPGPARDPAEQAQVGRGGRREHEDVAQIGRLLRGGGGPRQRARRARPPRHLRPIHADHRVAGPGEGARQRPADEAETDDGDGGPAAGHAHTSPSTRWRRSGSRRSRTRAAPAISIAYTAAAPASARGRLKSHKDGRSSSIGSQARKTNGEAATSVAAKKSAPSAAAPRPRPPAAEPP